MRITWSDTRGNGVRLATALREAGHVLVDQGGEVLLIDHDVPFGKYGPLCDAHARVFLHPHGGGYVQSWIDSAHPVHPHTRGMFVHGQGQADLLQRCGYELNLGVIGWSFSERRSFVAGPGPVIFAPQHAMDNTGWIDPELKSENLRILRLLRELPLRVIVRVVGALEPLELPSGFEMERGDGTIAGAQRSIDRAGLVIGSAWTFPAMALARGIPTIVFGQHGYRPRPIVTRAPWPETDDLERYPLDAGSAETSSDLWQLVEQACSGDAAIASWRERFIGPAFNDRRFVEMFELAVRTW